MDFHGGWRSYSRRTIVFVALAAAYYVALNAVLINELVERVQTGSLTAPAAPSRGPVEPEEASMSCADLGKLDRDICRADAMVTRASEVLREHRRERRAAQEQHRAAAAR